MPFLVVFGFSVRRRQRAAGSLALAADTSIAGNDRSTKIKKRHHASLRKEPPYQSFLPLYRSLTPNEVTATVPLNILLDQHPYSVNEKLPARLQIRSQ